MAEYFIGLMSGTSLDGVDAAIVAFEPTGFRVVATRYEPFSADLRQRLQTVCFADSVAMESLGGLDAELGELFGACVNRLLDVSAVGREEVIAIGSHGQTVFHRPHGQYPFTLQIGDPNRIAEVSGISTVADFRRRDIACGGQGAPLVPAFHGYAFQQTDSFRVVVNIGGIANLTVLPPKGRKGLSGFDSGPGNTLMDRWALKHLGNPIDRDGRWARSGRLDTALLNRLLGDPYFQRLPPKSTGQEYFSLSWLEQALGGELRAPEDIQCTLCHLTANSIALAVHASCPGAKAVLVCGGGAHNGYLMECLAHVLPCRVTTTAEFGVDPDWVEAVAFAWLARQTVNGQAGNAPEATGAEGGRVLGGFYRA
jgi:anhydro-N-acetylmuramic acid kinase